MKTKTAWFIAIVMVIAMFATACGTPGNTTPAAQTIQEQGEEVAANREGFSPVNDVEGNNYYDRLKIADDPTTILWCTSAFPIPSSPLFTVPHVGKLTSGSKRPYETSQVYHDTENSIGDWYSPEVAGPDGMFGSSAEYRYGFTPGGFYSEYTGLHTYCTDKPTIWQRDNTAIVLETDPVLLAAHTAARKALAEGNPESAFEILAEAINE